MEHAETVVNAVSTVGFPIVVTLLLLGFVVWLTITYNRNTIEIMERHEEEVKEMMNTINDLKIAVYHLTDLLKSIGERMD